MRALCTWPGLKRLEVSTPVQYCTRSGCPPHSFAHAGSLVQVSTSPRPSPLPPAIKQHMTHVSDSTGIINRTNVHAYPAYNSNVHAYTEISRISPLMLVQTEAVGPVGPKTLRGWRIACRGKTEAIVGWLRIAARRTRWTFGFILD